MSTKKVAGVAGAVGAGALGLTLSTTAPSCTKTEYVKRTDTVYVPTDPDTVIIPGQNDTLRYYYADSAGHSSGTNPNKSYYSGQWCEYYGDASTDANLRNKLSKYKWAAVDPAYYTNPSTVINNMVGRIYVTSTNTSNSYEQDNVIKELATVPNAYLMDGAQRLKVDGREVINLADATVRAKLIAYGIQTGNMLSGVLNEGAETAWKVNDSKFNNDPNSAYIKGFYQVLAGIKAGLSANKFYGVAQCFYKGPANNQYDMLPEITKITTNITARQDFPLAGSAGYIEQRIKDGVIAAQKPLNLYFSNVVTGTNDTSRIREAANAYNPMLQVRSGNSIYVSSCYGYNASNANMNTAADLDVNLKMPQGLVVKRNAHYSEGLNGLQDWASKEHSDSHDNNSQVAKLEARLRKKDAHAQEHTI